MADKLWDGRFSTKVDILAEEFGASIDFDSKLAQYDIKGSLAHVEMLKKQGIITNEDFNKIFSGLMQIKNDINQGIFMFSKQDEDIHMAIEKKLIDLLGQVGGKLHTARSRNDQVAVDIKMYLIDEIKDTLRLLLYIMETIVDKAKTELDVIMPGYTHLQTAQPILFSHYIMAYFQMFKRDYFRFSDCLERTNYSPLGACALAGTSFNIDRDFTAKKLGFIAPTVNSLDSVSDRDFIIETLSCISISQMHLSRLSEEMIIFSSHEFSFFTLPGEFCTGSSIMPQKVNPDMCELVRGKTGRIYGNLITVLTMMKGLPLAYNKDMQEDKEPLFDSLKNYKNCLEIMNNIIAKTRLNHAKMHKASEIGEPTATDLADYLVRKNLPFRQAHKITGKIVAYAMNEGTTMSNIDLDTLKTFSHLIEKDIYEFITIENSVNSKKSYGGTSPDAVEYQIKEAKKFLDEAIS